jgi:predicted small metal-binding protein
MEPAGSGTLQRPETWQVACADAGVPCGFLIRTHDRRELVEATVRHARGTHGLTGLTEQEVLAMARPVAW